ncbi:MAG: error-prone DNA polymerase, partial [Actinomycetales bacterium]|nr:error-prone DNA polymerase [Actinomycetales bacterium]
VYASSYLKCHYPAAFTAALLRSQPMGFYSPQSLVADARRHGVLTRGPDVLRSRARTDLETDDEHHGYRLDPPREQVQGERAAKGPTIRLGLDQVRGISTETAEQITKERARGGPFVSVPDLARRVRLTARQLEALATAGALDALATSRRQALWAAGAAAQESPETLPHLAVGAQAPMLPGMSDAELATADAWATGITLDEHPMALVRQELTTGGVLSIAGTRAAEDSTRIRVAGVITHRQRPATAGNVTFLSLEDETGILNVVCSQGFWVRHRALLRTARAIVLRGIVENRSGAVNLVADDVASLDLVAAGRSRDFQ